MAVDLVDYDEATQFALARELHEAMCQGVDAIDGAHDDGDRLHGFEHRQGATEEIRIAGRVDEIDVSGFEIETADGGIEGVLQALLLRIEVRDRGATLQAAFAADRARLQEQPFQQEGFTSAGRPHKRNVPDALCRIPHGQRSRHAQIAAMGRLLLRGGTCIASCSYRRPTREAVGRDVSGHRSAIGEVQ